MNKILRLYFFVLLFPAQVLAQQLLFPGNNYHASPSYYSTCFDNRYLVSYDRAATVSDAKRLKAELVKKVLVYSPENILIFSFELNTAGKVWRYGQWGNNYFTINSNTSSAYWDDVHAISYYEGSKMVRTDTTFVKYYDYKNKDTVMHFEKSKKRVYKIGYLLNEQNAYYNEKFYNKHYKQNPSNSFLHLPSCVTLNSKGQIIRLDPDSDILLRKKLKTNYDSTHLYYCSEENHNNNFYAAKDSGNTELQINKLSKHRFYRNFKIKMNEKYFVSGENFYEPPEYHMAMSCGNSIYYHQMEMEESRHYSSEIKYNDKGLYDTYYQLYYPIDTVAVKNKTANQQQDSTTRNSLPIIVQPNLGQSPGFYQPRSSVPVKTLIYYIRYEYFENL